MVDIAKETILKLKIKRANGDFTTFMSRKTNQSDAVSVLQYAAKKANAKQRRLVTSK